MYNTTYVPPITVACGATAYFDSGSGCAYRCGTCGAVLGSVAMPKACRQLEDDAANAHAAWKILGGEKYSERYDTD